MTENFPDIQDSGSNESPIPTFIERPSAPVSSVIPLGIGLNNAEISVDLCVDSHLLLIGPPGTGKSNVINTIMAHFMIAPSEWYLYGIDLKAIELNPFRRFDRIQNISNTLEQAIELTESILSVMEGRYRRVAAQEVDSYAEIASNSILLIVQDADELFGWTSEIEESTHRLLKNMMYDIIRRGRAVGIHLVLSTQTLSPSILPLKDDIAVIATGAMIETTAQTLVGNEALRLPYIKGRSYLESEGTSQQFQAYLTPISWFDQLDD